MAVVGLVILVLLLLRCIASISRRYQKMMQDRIDNALRERNRHKDTFQRENGYSWDYVLVFKVRHIDEVLTPKQEKHSLKNIVQILADAGLQTRLFYSVQHDEVYCKIRAPMSRICSEAERIGMMLQLEPTFVSMLLREGYVMKHVEAEAPASTTTVVLDLPTPPATPALAPAPAPAPATSPSPDRDAQQVEAPSSPNTSTTPIELATASPHQTLTPTPTPTPATPTPPESKTVRVWGPISIPHTNIETSIEPYEFVYAPYTTQMAERHLYKKSSDLGDSDCFLRSVDRLKLITSILGAKIDDGGCQLNLYKLMRNDCIIGFFGIHDRVELRTLEKKWLTFLELPSHQKVDLVRDYFGEKIGFYFLFLGHYTSWLMWASLVGCIVYLDVAIEDDNPNAVLTPYFAAFMALWSTLFLESFKRIQGEHTMKWGMTDMEENETPRPEFISDRSVTDKYPHPVTGSLYYFYPRSEDRKRKCLSTGVSSFFIMAVIAAVIGTFAARFVLMSSSESSVANAAGIVASLINAVQIQIMGGLYSFISLKLNKYENHRTETQYEDALISKTFVIQFINSFSSMFFIAFGQMFLADVFESVPYCTGDRRAGGCMKVLQTTMGILFLTNLISGSLTTVLVPYLQRRLKEAKEFEGASVKNVSEIEHEFMLLDYHPINGSFSDYGVLVLQFGYATMFISAYPLASVLALVNNYVMQRLNAWKFCQMCRRPEPRNAEDIGSWLIILEIISYMAVFVSSGLVAFTGNIAVNSTWSDRAWIFFGQSAGIIAVKVAVSLLSPELSREVEIQLERQEFIRDKIFYNVPDEVEPSVITKRFNADVSTDIRINDDDPL